MGGCHSLKRVQSKKNPKPAAPTPGKMLPKVVVWMCLVIIANGLPVWSGAQLAVDTTLVFALDSL